MKISKDHEVCIFLFFFFAEKSIINLIYENETGFGFITFELEESANQVLQEHYIQFNGKQVCYNIIFKL